MGVSFDIAEQAPLQNKTHYHTNSIFNPIYQVFL